ncbi:hypothetical protein DFP72DRAFT_787824, partial [Ephemerocybe angulata]
MRKTMPFWYHRGTKKSVRPRYGDKWGVCHRQTHGIKTVGDMLAHAQKNTSWGHTGKINCQCRNCSQDRSRGCTDPIACRKNANTKLNYLDREWDP